MPSFSKRKRNTRDMRCVLFPEDVQEAFTKRSCGTSKATKSWERCRESFSGTGIIKKPQITGRMCTTVQQLGQSSKLDTDDFPFIDSDSENEGHENSTSKQQTHVVVGEISDYSSSDSEAAPAENTQLNDSAVESTEPRQWSVSEWIRSAQALLQTPQKQINKTSKTPEDSGKKRHRFECGGLAERLNRLQRRQRSAVSFWRHQSMSSFTTATEERPGVLMLHVQNVWSNCGMQAALCQRPDKRKEPCVALFSKDTTTHLAPTVSDTIHVYPPWQSLIVEGEQHPIILNTHFSQKVLSEVKQNSGVSCTRNQSSFPSSVRPYPLTRCLWQSNKYLKSTQSTQSSPSKQVCALVEKDGGDAFESLLEAIEDSGPSGFLCGSLKVVVQRVYFFPVKYSSTTNSLTTKTVSKTLLGPMQQQHIGRFCMLVQDVYGMFSEVELQYVSSEVELKRNTEWLEGKVCVLQGLKVIQRLTRERCTQLFSLIDSLWPPLGPLRVYREQTDKVPSPSFCYRLAGQQGCVLPQHVSPLYQPPVIHTLQEVLQNEPTSGRCSFKAALVYKREQSVGEDLLLFVTDPCLQSIGSNRRTLPVYVSPSCLLQTSIRQAITTPHLRPTIIFRDVVIENGLIFCCGQSVIQLGSEHNLNLSLPQPILLNQLSLESTQCSLCTLTGLVVDVDEESAFLWPTCRQCGSDCLEAMQNKQEAFLCITCKAVDKPIMKMQLEVFVNCPLLSHCTVKIKLLQKSIMSLLNSAGCAEEYEVKNVLGKQVGPLSAFIHVISRTSTLWMSLEEILL